MKKRIDFDYANYCLEELAKWSEDDNGFPSRSATAKFGEMRAHRSESSLPTGIEPNSLEVDRALMVLSIMSDSSSKSKARADILKKVSRNACNDETIQQTIDRLGVDRSRTFYFEALDEFAVRLEMFIYSHKIVKKIEEVGTVH